MDQLLKSSFTFLLKASNRSLQSYELFTQHLETIQTGTHILAITAVVICLLRGAPVLMDGITHIQPAQKHHIST